MGSQKRTTAIRRGYVFEGSGRVPGDGLCEGGDATRGGRGARAHGCTEDRGAGGGDGLHRSYAVCRWKCDTRRSKISLCPRRALCFRRLLLVGRDRGRDNFIFFQVGKGRGLIPPRPDVLLLVLRKYKAPGPRRLPPRHRNNRPPSLSSSPLRQIISPHLLCSTAVPSASSGSLHAGATA